MYTGENIAAGFAAAADVLRGWQNSAPHNATLLSPNFDAVRIGLAYDAGPTYKWCWAADFAGAAVPPTDAAAAEAERLARIEALAFARFEHLLGSWRVSTSSKYHPR